MLGCEIFYDGNQQLEALIQCAFYDVHADLHSLRNFSFHFLFNYVFLFPFTVHWPLPSPWTIQFPYGVWISFSFPIPPLLFLYCPSNYYYPL